MQYKNIFYFFTFLLIIVAGTTAFSKNVSAYRPGGNEAYCVTTHTNCANGAFCGRYESSGTVLCACPVGQNVICGDVYGNGGTSQCRDDQYDANGVGAQRRLCWM